MAILKLSFEVRSSNFSADLCYILVTVTLTVKLMLMQDKIVKTPL